MIETAPAPSPAVVLAPVFGSAVVRVNRQSPAPLPEGVELLSPEIWVQGPELYFLEALFILRHKNQLLGEASGEEILELLEVENRLADCLSLDDIVAIQALGPSALRSDKRFVGSTLFAWRSACISGTVRTVPFVREEHGQLVRGWRDFRNGFGFYALTPTFK